MPMRLHPFDLALVALYLIGITLFGLRFKTKDTSLQSYFLAGRTTPWWAIALSIVSAETSTLTIIGIPALSFAGNFGFLQVALGYMLGRIVICFLFLPRYFEGTMLTAYQLIDRRFGPVLHKITAGLFLATRAAAEGVRVYAISIVVSLAIGVGDILSLAIISALTLLYTFEGGMAAVIWTDVVQMALYLVGTLIALFTLGTHVPGGWHTIHAVAGAAGKFHMLDFTFSLTKSYTFWAGVFGGTFLTMASHGTDQLLVQRLLAAKNMRESRMALLGSGVVIFVQFFLFLLIGSGLYVFYGLHPQNFGSGNRIFPTFIVQQMPMGIAGLLIAAILAAAMSNLSAALNSLSSTTVVDFYLGSKRKGQQEPPMLVSRISTFTWALVLFAIAVYSVLAGGKGNVVELGLSIASVAYGSLLGVFLLGSMTRYATQTGAIIGMVVGFAFNLVLWLQSLHLLPNPILGVHLPAIAFTWYVILGSLITFLVGSVMSLLKPNRKTALAALLLAAMGCTAVSLHAQASTTQPTPLTNTYDFSQIDTLMDAAVTQQHPSGGVVVIGHAGHVVFHKAYGNRSIDPVVEPMTEETIFDMASLSKCLATATALMQLYEQGKFQLDDPVAKYLPAFAVNGKDKITIRQIVTHHSGLAPDIPLKDGWGLTAPNRAEGVKRALESTPAGPAGVKFVYSDINFIVAGLLVEQFSGEREDQYVVDHIYQPLGMIHTRYLPYDKVCGMSKKVGAAVVYDPNGPMAKCDATHWSGSLITNIAPTTHDDEGNAETNPHFDMVTRGTVHDPTTRRMGGVAGHAGIFSTAADVEIYAQALLDRLAGRPSNFPLKTSTLRIMCEPQQPAGSKDLRGIGWDIDTPFSKPRGDIFPVGSFGHTGYTGTSLWMDPRSNTYVLILTNAVHPRVHGAVTTLRKNLATAAAKSLQLYQPQSANASTAQVRTGIDVLETTHFAALQPVIAAHGGHLKMGLLTNQTGMDRKGKRTIDILYDAPLTGLQLTTLFSPEHGILGKEDKEGIASTTDPTTHLPVISLYGTPAQRHPTHEQVKDLDAIVLDLQDVGVRFYTYETVLGYFLETAATEKTLGHRLDVIVLDRPAFTSGVQVTGPMLDAGKESYIAYMQEPTQHSLTYGELALFIQGEKHFDVPVTVVRLQNWQRGLWYDSTGLPWINPSPNLRTMDAAALYPGVAYLEMTNVSVGRGTATPFEQVGASWIASDEESTKLATELNGFNVSGVNFEPTTFTPDKPYPDAGTLCHGVHIVVTDRSRVQAGEVGIALLSALHHLYPTTFHADKAMRIIGNQATLDAVLAGTDPHKITASWEQDLFHYRETRQKYLLYGYLPPPVTP